MRGGVIGYMTERAGAERPNSRASCEWLRWIMVGRPWGHVWRKSHRESWSRSDCISGGDSRSPARTDEWQATAHLV